MREEWCGLKPCPILTAELRAEIEGFAGAMCGRHQGTNPYIEVGVLTSGDRLQLRLAWLRGWNAYRLKGKAFPDGILQLYRIQYESESREYAEECAKIDFQIFLDDCGGPHDRKTCYRMGVLPEWLAAFLGTCNVGEHFRERPQTFALEEQP